MDGRGVSRETYYCVFLMILHCIRKNKGDEMEEKERAIFSRSLIYNQEDKQYSEHHDAFFDCYSSIWAFSWMLPGMTHPITTRGRIIIVENPDDREYVPINVSLDIWKEYTWYGMDELFVSNTQFKNRSQVENEALCRYEAFLMGVNIDEVKSRYADDFAEEVSEEEEDSSTDKEEINPNVISFIPPKD